MRNEYSSGKRNSGAGLRHLPGFGLVGIMIVLAVVVGGCSDGPGEGSDPSDRPFAASEKLAAAIRDSVAQQIAFMQLALNYADAGRIDDANRVAAQLRLPDQYVAAKTRIAEKLADSGKKTEASQALADARAGIAGIGSFDTRIVRLLALAVAHAKVGNRNEANVALNEARALVDSIPDPFFRIRVLCLTAESSAQAGDTAAANGDLERAISLRPLLKGPSEIAMGYVAISEAAVGDPGGALAVASSSELVRVRFDGVLAAARGYGRRGRTDTAVVLLKRAEEIARAEGAAHSRFPGLAQVAGVYGEIGQQQQALDILGEIQTAANADSSATGKFDAAAIIAMGFLGIKEFEAATHAAETAVEYSVAFQNPNVLTAGVQTLTSIAERFIDSGAVAAGIRLLDRARELARQVGPEQEAQLLPQLIFDYARARRFDVAWELLGSTGIDVGDKAKLSAALAAEHAKARRAPDEKEQQTIDRIVKEAEPKPAG